MAHLLHSSWENIYMFWCVFSLDGFPLKGLSKNDIKFCGKGMFHKGYDVSWECFQERGGEPFFKIHVTQLRYPSRDSLTDQWPTDYRPTNYRPFTHWSTDPIMIFKRLGNRKKIILQKTNVAGKVFWSVNYLMNNIRTFLELGTSAKKMWFPTKHIQRN